MTATFASESVDALGTVGFVRLAGPFGRLDDAWNAARLVVDATIAPGASLDVIADYVIPPPDGPTSRDFQTLHLDFGLPLVPVAPADVACFTALHIAAETVTERGMALTGTSRAASHGSSRLQAVRRRSSRA